MGACFEEGRLFCAAYLGDMTLPSLRPSSSLLQVSFRWLAGWLSAIAYLLRYFVLGSHSLRPARLKGGVITWVLQRAIGRQVAGMGES